jgi:hypothetical protein
MESWTTGRYFWAFRREGNLYSAPTSYTGECTGLSPGLMAASGFVHQPLVDQGPPSLWTQPPGRRSDLGRPPLQEGHRPRMTTLTSAPLIPLPDVALNSKARCGIQGRRSAVSSTTCCGGACVVLTVWGGDWVGILWVWEEGLRPFLCVEEITDSCLLTHLSLDWTQTEPTICDFFQVNISRALYERTLAKGGVKWTLPCLCTLTLWPLKKKHSLSPSTS